MQTQPTTQNRHHTDSASSVNSSPRSKRTRRLRTVAGGVVAAGVLAINLGAAPGTDTPAEPVRTVVDQSAVAAWASANGMRGSSPTSLSAAPETAAYMGVDQSAVAAWAVDNGMRGSSPASLSAAPETAAYMGVDQSAVAAWAMANGLQGSSPTSLGSPTGHSRPTE